MNYYHDAELTKLVREGLRSVKWEDARAEKTWDGRPMTYYMMWEDGRPRPLSETRQGGDLQDEYYLVPWMGAYVEKALKGEEGPAYRWWKDYYEHPTTSQWSHNLLYGLDTMTN